LQGGDLSMTDLDAVSTRHPIFVIYVDGQVALPPTTPELMAKSLASYAKRAAAIDQETSKRQIDSTRAIWMPYAMCQSAAALQPSAPGRRRTGP